MPGTTGQPTLASPHANRLYILTNWGPPFVVVSLKVSLLVVFLHNIVLDRSVKWPKIWEYGVLKYAQNLQE